MGVLTEELQLAGKKFEATADRELPLVNPQLWKAKLEPLAMLTQEAWAKR